jgi:putative oxidoreductase
VTVTLELNLRSILRWVVGVIFIWAALSKLANLQDFYSSLVAYQLALPALLLRLIATTLPWLELFCGLMLISRFWLRAAMLWALVLCAVFTVVTAQAWARGLQISCGCLNLDFLGLAAGGKTFMLLESVGFAFVRALLLVTATVYLLRDGSKQSGRPTAAAVSSPDYA